MVKHTNILLRIMVKKGDKRKYIGKQYSQLNEGVKYKKVNWIN